MAIFIVIFPLLIVQMVKNKLLKSILINRGNTVYSTVPCLCRGANLINIVNLSYYCIISV